VTHDEMLARLEEIEAEREAERAAQMAEAQANCHIRKRAGKNLGNQYYSHTTRAQFRGDYVDPMSQTLCGGEATIADWSWADTRHASNRTYVACERCIEIRVAGLNKGGRK